jgi:hypothetical protein
LRNAVEVRNTQFGSDVDRLIEKIRGAKQGSWAANHRLATALILFAAVCVAGWAWWSRVQGPDEQSGLPKQHAAAPVRAPLPKDLSRIRLRQAVLVRAGEADWQWIEKDPRDNHEAVFHFRQQASSPNELLLYDQRRDIYAHLNFTDKRAYWRFGQVDPWKWNYDILEIE